MTRRRAGLVEAGYPYLVAEQDGVLLGYAYAGAYRTRPAYRSTVEDSIYVAPEAQGRGIGRQLLAALIDECERRGFRLMVAIIGDRASTGSIRLHEALGFAHVGVLRGRSGNPADHPGAGLSGEVVDQGALARRPRLAAEALAARTFDRSVRQQLPVGQNPAVAEHIPAAPTIAADRSRVMVVEVATMIGERRHGLSKAPAIGTTTSSPTFRPRLAFQLGGRFRKSDDSNIHRL
jgi:GNAT superfamily N-acetyltransferase